MVRLRQPQRWFAETVEFSGLFIRFISSEPG
jgi:hypothetical protein